MSAVKDDTSGQVAEAVKPTLQERVKRLRAIQERTTRRNNKLRAGVWSSDVDETLDINVLIPAKHA